MNKYKINQIKGNKMSIPKRFNMKHTAVKKIDDIASENIVDRMCTDSGISFLLLTLIALVKFSFRYTKFIFDSVSKKNAEIMATPFRVVSMW